MNRTKIDILQDSVKLLEAGYQILGIPLPEKETDGIEVDKLVDLTSILVYALISTLHCMRPNFAAVDVVPLFQAALDDCAIFTDEVQTTVPDGVTIH